MRLTVPNLLALAGITACVTHNQPPPPSIEGAWQIVQVSRTNEPADTSLQPSMYIFAARHYSLLRVNGTEPRRVAKTVTRATMTDAEMRTIVMPFFANAGTYELRDSTLIMKRTISLMPNTIGSVDSVRALLAGDTLRIIRRTRDGLELRTTLVRLR